MAKPARIVSLLASGTEILFGLGLAERVVAVSHECDHPSQVRTLPRATFSHIDSQQSSDAIDSQVRQLSVSGAALYEIDRRRLLELKPDLIVTQSQCDVCAVKYQDVVDLVRSDARLAGTRVVALNPLSLDDVFQDILRVGQAAGSAPEAQRFVDQLRLRVECIQDRAAQLDKLERPRVACIEWVEPLMLAANWMPQLIELAGGLNGLTEHGQHSTYSRWEDLVHYDPELLLVMPCGFDLERSVAELRVLSQLPGWHQLTAVKQQRVYAADGNAYFNRSGPRLVDSLEILAHLFHPDTFPDPVPRGTAWRAIGESA